MFYLKLVYSISSIKQTNKNPMVMIAKSEQYTIFLNEEQNVEISYY